MERMPLFPSLGRTIGTAIRGTRAVLRGSAHSGRWALRRVGLVRSRGAGGEPGMTRLFDLHAASCAGDTLITIGLAGTIFFSAPLGEARGGVALYLLVTMVPFALLAPVVGPVLDHFRHGRRYALAATMLGRAFLAWLISDHINGFGLYPAAFGVLALSRAYGIGRSAAVPRLLPAGLGLSQAGARASVYGTIAGAAVAPLGLAAFWLGPQWPLRVASVIFLVGMVIALRLPPRADADPPMSTPRAFAILRPLRGTGQRILSGRLVVSALIGGATLRCLYGFLLLFLAFAVKAGDLTTVLFDRDLADEGALGLIGAALATGSFLATAVGSRIRIHHPLALQSSGLVIVAGVGVLAALRFSLLMAVLFCFVTAAVSGIAKLSVDATIQERIDERLRASAFAHSETILMLAFVTGGAVGLIPLDGRIGVLAASGFAVLAAGRAVLAAGRLRGDRLNGRADEPTEPANPAAPTEPAAPTAPAAPTESPPAADPTMSDPDTSQVPAAGTVAGTASRHPSPRPVPARRRPRPAPAGHPPANTTVTDTDPTGTEDTDEASLAPPGFHIYRPSSAIPGHDPDGSRTESPGPKG